MNLSQTRDMLYLAALLHDIGKFYQRGDKSGVKTSVQIDDFHKNLESAICPVKDGRYTHKHVVWTAQFFTDFRTHFEDNADAFGSDINSRKRIVRWAAAHHQPNPESLEECIIQLADHCSSGVDRTTKVGLNDEETEYDYEVSKGWDKFKEVRMKSVFENLLGNPIDKYKLPIESLNLSSSFFPKHTFTESGQVEYEKLWKSFVDELKSLPVRDSKQLGDSILYLLEKYTATVPSSTQHLPDVSLYEHLRSTAAYSICLYDYLTEQKRTKCQVSPDEKPFLLIGGDLSGIQSYIYDIIGKGAAKNLKGRSFYLQLIVQVIVDYLIDELQLYRSNIVYSSGGGFYILAPNTTFVKNKLGDLIETISAKIREEHGTKLYLAIDYQEIQKNQVFNGEISEIWTELTHKLSSKKLNRFSTFIAEKAGYTFFFEPNEEGGQTSRDAVTGEEFAPNEERFPFDDDLDKVDTQVKKSTFEQIRLGKTLRDNIIYQVITSKPIQYWEYDYTFYGKKTHRYFRPLGLSKYYYLLNDKEIHDLKQRVKGSVDDAIILKVNDTNFSDFQLTGNRNVNGFTFYGGNDLPRQDDKALFFDALAGDSSVSFKRLGILRMDVDRLGLIFKSGFPDEKRTFSRYSTLSRSLDFFFKGYLNTIWKENPEFKANTFILYAGGDDLFILGKWDVTLAFAQKIQKEFMRWTCDNPEMGISAGMAIVGGRFPIAKAALQSEGEEKRAKGHIFQKKAKNAISFMETPFAWGEEFGEVEGLKNQLVKLVDTENSLPKGFLNKVSSFHAMKVNQAKNGENPSWRWMSAYDLSRAKERIKSTEAKLFLEIVKKGIFVNAKMQGSNYDYLDILHFAARWAELEIRSKNQK